MEEQNQVLNQSFIVTGLITEVHEARSGVSQMGREWMSQEYVLESSGDYHRVLQFEVYGAERIANFAIQQGDMVTVTCDVESRRWKDRYFTTVRAFRCIKQKAPQANYVTPQQQPQTAPQQAPAPQPQQFSNAPKVAADEVQPTQPENLPF